MSSLGHRQTQYLILRSCDMKQDIDGIQPAYVYVGAVNEMFSHTRCYKDDIISLHNTRRACLRGRYHQSTPH